MAPSKQPKLLRFILPSPSCQRVVSPILASFDLTTLAIGCASYEIQILRYKCPRSGKCYKDPLKLGYLVVNTITRIYPERIWDIVMVIAVNSSTNRCLYRTNRRPKRTSKKKKKFGAKGCMKRYNLHGKLITLN